MLKREHQRAFVECKRAVVLCPALQSSTQQARGLRASRTWQAANFPLSLYDASWFRLNLLMGCPKGFRWSSTCQPDFIADVREKVFCLLGMILMNSQDSRATSKLHSSKRF